MEAPQDILPLLSKALEHELYGPLGTRRCFDVERFAYLLATVESAKFFQDNMRLAKNCVTQFKLLEFALSKVETEGMCLEFGVATGRSTNFIASQTKGPIYAFDSFEGLPEDWTHFQKEGRYSQNGRVPDNLKGNITPVVGWFDQSLPPFLSEHRANIAFVHIDCDLYSSTVTILQNIHDRISKGTVIVFDEFFNYPGWQHHEFKAFNEFVDKYGVAYEFIGFASSHYSVAVRILS